LLLMPSTLLMGCAFPVLQRVVQTDLAHLGRRVGVLLLANVFGSLVGTVLTGWLLLDRFGTAGTVRLLTVMSAGFALLAFVLAGHERAPARATRVSRVDRLRMLAVAVLVGVVLVVLPDEATLWAHLHGSFVEEVVLREDG